MFLFSHTSRPAVEPTQLPVENIQGVVSLGVKRSSRQSYRLPQSAVEVRSVWSYTPTPSVFFHDIDRNSSTFNPLNPELNPICYLLALVGAHHFLYVSRIRVKLLTFMLLMSYIYIYIYIYGAPILDVSRSHTTTQHSQ